MKQGKYFWRVTSIGGSTELVHGYFTSLHAAIRYVMDIHAANVPLVSLQEIEPDDAKNDEIKFTDDTCRYTWYQTPITNVYDYYGNLEDIKHWPARTVIINIDYVKLYINEGMFDVPSLQTAPEWLEEHGASTRTVNCLKRNNNFSLHDISYLGLFFYELPDVRNMGIKCITEIKDILEKEGIEIIEKPPKGSDIL